MRAKLGYGIEKRVGFERAYHFQRDILLLHDEDAFKNAVLQPSAEELVRTKAVRRKIHVGKCVTKIFQVEGDGTPCHMHPHTEFYKAK